MELQFETPQNGVTVVRLAGRLDLTTATSVKQQLMAAIAEGHVRLIVDLAEVTFIDSSGLGLLIGTLKAARLANGDLRIARPNEQARTILQLTMLERILEPYSSVEEAREQFEQPAAR